MFIHRADADALLAAMVDSIQTDVLADVRLLCGLLDGDDWSFVIKAQALVEALLTDLLVAHVSSPEVRSVFERLPLADDEMGKLRLARDLGLLGHPERACIRKLASLRNKLAHGRSMLAFTFADYFAEMNRDQRTSWQDAILWFADDAQTKESWVLAFAQNPRVSFLMSILMLMASLRVGCAGEATRARIDKLARETTEELLAMDSAST